MPRYGNKRIYVDDSEFQRKAKKLARKLKIDEYDFVKEQTGILAREVAKMTPPYVTFPKLTGTGIGTAKDIKAGEWAVYHDLRQICIVVPDNIADWARRVFKGGAIYKKGQVIAPGVFSSVGFMREWHEKNKMPNGRTRELSKPLLPWVAQSVFEIYLKSEQANVGVAKAAFYKASLALGAKGAAVKGIKRHLIRTSGDGNMKRAKKGPIATISGRADGLWHAVKHLPRLQRNRLIKAVKRLEFVGRQSAKKAGFKTR